MFDLAQLAVIIGVANGFILLVKPIARLHVRIDRNEGNIVRLQQDFARLQAIIDREENTD